MIKIKDQTLNVSFQDSGPWRSYELSDCYGDSIEECRTNLTVSEVDQDGGELNCYSYEDSSNEIQKEIDNLLNQVIIKVLH